MTPLVPLETCARACDSNGRWVESIISGKRSDLGRTDHEGKAFLSQCRRPITGPFFVRSVRDMRDLAIATVAAIVDLSVLTTNIGNVVRVWTYTEWSVIRNIGFRGLVLCHVCILRTKLTINRSFVNGYGQQF